MLRGINTRHYKKWLSSFLTGRHAYTVYNGTPTTRRRFPNRVPQWSALSRTLFDLFMHDIPIPAHPDIHIVSYVDDITIFSQHNTRLHSNRKKVSPSKSTLTLNTPHADEYNLQPTISLNSIPISYTDTATTLGVTYEKK